MNYQYHTTNHAFPISPMPWQLLLEGFECVSKQSSLSFFDNGILIAQFIDVSADDHDAASGIVIIYFKTHTWLSFLRVIYKMVVNHILGPKVRTAQEIATRMPSEPSRCSMNATPS